MLLRSALEDFENSTLSAVPGLLGKLRYLARLHNGGGAYSHWGLGKVYGSGPAENAIRVRDAIRKDDWELVSSLVPETTLEFLKSSAAAAQIADREFLSSLEKPGGNVLPAQSLHASAKHFRSVLQALSALARNKAPATSRDESPLPPPVQ